MDGSLLAIVANPPHPWDKAAFGVNPSQLPPGALVGASRPAPRLDGSDFWAQGIDLDAVLSF
jgi:hypothetical protein